VYKEYLDKLKQLLAIEYNCSPDCFFSDENILTVSALNEGRRKYSPDKPFFGMVTLGKNTVITADECLREFLEGYIKTVREGHRLFEYPNLMSVSEELGRYGYKLMPTHHMFLPCRMTEPVCEYPVKWFYDREIDMFYGDKRFPNAIYEKYLPERPDRIAVIAYDGDKIMGMAGSSEDAPGWQQIGIDVMPEYRSKGVGSYLVTLIKNKIAERGDIPFYGTQIANYCSWNTALNCGFKPVWVETGAIKIK
jgi:GNAT superfamily N-acetyltransferase